MTEKREIPPSGILKEWVAKLGLRHQGVLVSIVRGCDTAQKHAAIKYFTRFLRGEILNTHCADASDARTFIRTGTGGDIQNAFEQASQVGLDEMPHHYVMHLVHAVEILAYYHPCPSKRPVFNAIYSVFCLKLHLNRETKEELDARLNADERSFEAGQV